MIASLSYHFPELWKVWQVGRSWGGGGGVPGWCYGKQGVGVVEGFQAKVMQNIPAWG